MAKTHYSPESLREATPSQCLISSIACNQRFLRSPTSSSTIIRSKLCTKLLMIFLSSFKRCHFSSLIMSFKSHNKKLLIKTNKSLFLLKNWPNTSLRRRLIMNQSVLSLHMALSLTSLKVIWRISAWKIKSLPLIACRVEKSLWSSSLLWEAI